MKICIKTLYFVYYLSFVLKNKFAPLYSKFYLNGIESFNIWTYLI